MQIVMDAGVGMLRSNRAAMRGSSREGTESRVVVAIDNGAHACRQVGRKHNGASFGSPFRSMVPDSVLKSVVTAARNWVGYVDPDQKSTPFRTVWADSHGRSTPGRAMSRKRKNKQEDRCARVALPEPECCRCRHRSDGDLHRRACGSRSATGSPFLRRLRKTCTPLQTG